MLELEFKSGKLSIPAGCHVISTGCGMGKTTAVKKLIEKYKNDISLLYCARTIKECDEMYEYCMSIPEVNTSVALLHSESKDYFKYKNSPAELRSKHILICTHAQLNSMPYMFTLLVNRRKNYKWDLDYFYRNLSDVTYRKFIIIDEAIEIPGNRFIISREDYSRRYDYIRAGIKMVPITSDESSVDKLNDFYTDEYGKSELPNSLVLNKDDYVNSVIFYNGLGKFDNKNVRFEKDQVELFNSLYDAVNQKLEGTIDDPYVLILDGTGDINYKGSSQFNIEKLSNPNPHVSFNRLESNLYRRYTSLQDALTTVDKAISEVKNVLESNNKTLIVTYKDLKGDLAQGYMSNCSLDYIKYLTDNLSEYSDKYSLIYYQSGLDKATNEFIDYDSIIFLGEFNISSSGIQNHNYYNKTSFDALDHKIQLLVQAIYRTRLRKYDGSTVNVYYTSDWNPSVTAVTEKYIVSGTSYTNAWNMFDIECGISNRLSSKLKLLFDYDSSIEDYVNSDRLTPLNLGWWSVRKMKEVFGPIKDSTISDYISTVTNLKKFNIHIKLYSYRSKYPKVANNEDGRVFEIFENEVDKYLSDGWSFYKGVNTYE